MTPEEIVSTARVILEKSNPIDYLLKVAGEFHVGDIDSLKILLSSIVIGSCLNAYGTQPKLSGGSGKGKTHLCDAVYHLMPKEWIARTLLSPKVLYRAANKGFIRSGMIIYSDDVRIMPELEETLKRAMSNFQQKAEYWVTNKNGDDLHQFYLPERISWWLTSVDLDQEEQLLNRFFPIDIDESNTQTQKVFKNTFKTLIYGCEEWQVTDEVLVCREIITVLKKAKYVVKAPFLQNADGSLRVKWIADDDRRNPGRFVDLLIAHAIWFVFQRDYKIVDNIVYVTATEDDFNAAKELYESRSSNLGSKLSNNELHLMNYLSNKASSLDSGNKSRNGIYRFYIKDLMNDYIAPNGEKPGQKYIERMLLGRNEQNRRSYGLIDKVSALEAEKVTGTSYNVHSDAKTDFRSSVSRWIFTFHKDKYNGKSSAVVLDPYRPSLDPPNGSKDNQHQEIDNNIIINSIDPEYPNNTETSESSICALSGSVGSMGLTASTDSESLGSSGGSSVGRGGIDLYDYSGKVVNPPKNEYIEFFDNGD